MLYILLTPENTDPLEIPTLKALIAQGALTHIHLRKPCYTSTQIHGYLTQFSPHEQQQFRLHSHHTVANKFAVGGLHFNTHTPQDPQQTYPSYLSKSRSCHSFAEVEASPWADYVFLSPIFDSISKQGYPQAFDHKDLADFLHKSQLPPVIALGGISAQNIAHTRQLGFSGAAVLGTFWQIQGIEARCQFWETLISG